MEKKGIPVELPLLFIRIWWYGVTTNNQITSLILARGYEVKVLLFRLPREEEDVFPATIDSSHLDLGRTLRSRTACC